PCVIWRSDAHLKPAGMKFQGTAAGVFSVAPSRSNLFIGLDLFPKMAFHSPQSWRSPLPRCCPSPVRWFVRLTGGVDMDTFGRIVEKRTFELLLVTGGALVMGLLTLIYLI